MCPNCMTSKIKDTQIGPLSHIHKTKSTNIHTTYICLCVYNSQNHWTSGEKNTLLSMAHVVLIKNRFHVISHTRNTRHVLLDRLLECWQFLFIYWKPLICSSMRYRELRHLIGSHRNTQARTHAHTHTHTQTHRHTHKHTYRQHRTGFQLTGNTTCPLPWQQLPSLTQ